MKLSFNWLKKYVSLPGSVSAEEVAEKLKLATVEVEGIERQGELLGNVVVGKVIKAEKHPQADKLTLCQVDIKTEKLQIVCGGSNVREGMLVALAKIGAKVKWHGEVELVELKPTAIRGIESFGMICGANEIGLETMFPPKEEKEIIDLTGRTGDKFIGKPLAEALDLHDIIFEIDNKSLSNRPDLWGHYGMAREVAALFGKTVKEYESKKIDSKKPSINLQVEVGDKKLCPRYMAVAIGGIKIAESPDWMRKELTAAGLRPINNIVDITNYILLDLGQPMHAFDAAQLAGNKEQGTKIVVRRAEKDEVLTLLDDSQIELSSDDLVIADSEKPLALAGVMGGKYSGISDKTETIIFESANFSPSAIRKTSTRLGIRTDSSARFEKSLDPNWCEMALRRAVELTLKFCPGASVVSEVIDNANFSLATGPIIVEKNIFEKKLGVRIADKEIVKILTSLGFAVKDKGEKLSVTIPTWRATKDISIAEDLVEEVARVWGYDKIISTMPAFKIIPPAKNSLLFLKNTISEILVRGYSFDEVYNYSFISPEQIKAVGGKENYIELDNPLSKEKPFLRRSLLPNMIENAVKNIEFFDSVRIFETGKIFWPEMPGMRADENGGELLPRQDNFVCALYAAKKDSTPFTHIRRILETIMDSQHLNFSVEELKSPAAWMHPTRSGEIIAADDAIGTIYEINPVVADKFGLQCRSAVLEINLDTVARLSSEEKAAEYRPLPEFPEVIRDIAFVVEKNISHDEIVIGVKNIDPLIKKIELFDLFEGKNVSEGKKSVAYRLTFADPSRTLNSGEVDKAVEKVTAELKKKFRAEVRG